MIPKNVGLYADYRRQIAKWVRLHPRSERRFALELAKQKLPACWEGQ